MFKKQSRFVAALVVALVAFPVAATSTERAAGQDGEYHGKLLGHEQRRPKPIKLTENDVTGFIEVVGRLKQFRIAPELRGAKTDTSGMAEALAANAEARGIVLANGFTVERFQRVVHSIGYAMVALETEGKQPMVAAALKQKEQALVKTEGSLTPEQLEQIRAHSALAGSYTIELQDLDPESLKWVKKYRDEIDKQLADPVE